jgi:Na+-transporting methylmalonyl-CoA/oxaloacetate decarboxylase gamma subunit
MNTDGSINWYYIWATLIIRFVGVFIILSTLALGIFIMSKIVAKFAGVKDNKVKDKV